MPALPDLRQPGPADPGRRRIRRGRGGYGRLAVLGGGAAASGLSGVIAVAVDRPGVVVGAFAVAVTGTIAAAVAAMFCDHQCTLRARIAWHGANRLADALADAIDDSHRAALTDAGALTAEESERVRAAARAIVNETSALLLEHLTGPQPAAHQETSWRPRGTTSRTRRGQAPASRRESV